MDDQTITKEKVSLADISLGELKRMPAKGLRSLCKAEEMTTDGKKKELFDRLCAKKFGRTKRYVGKETRCAFCGKGVMVKSTKSETINDGRTLVIRNIKCRGRNSHTYPLKELV